MSFKSGDRIKIGDQWFVLEPTGVKEVAPPLSRDEEIAQQYQKDWDAWSENYVPKEKDEPKLADYFRRHREWVVRAFEEALTPSGETKGAYHGEFYHEREFTDDEGNSQVVREYIPWTVTKDIMRAILKRAKDKLEG